MKYVFTKPEGAIANLELFAKVLSNPRFQAKVIVEVFDSGGRKHTVRDAAEAMKLHAQMVASKAGTK